MKNKKSVEHELLVVDIIKTADILTSRLSVIHKAHGITMMQYNILRILRGARPDMLGVGEVKQRMLFSNSDVSRLIDRLVVKGYVERNICPGNRRKMNVCISPDGLELLTTLDEEMYNALDGFYEKVVPISEVGSMRASLHKIIDCGGG